MTKTEELAAFHTFRHSLPANSYLRPWLDSIADEIESALRSDFFPCASLRAAQQQAATLTKAASEEAAAIIQTAKDRAATIAEDAREKIAATLRRAQAAITAADNALARF